MNDSLVSRALKIRINIRTKRAYQSTMSGQLHVRTSGMRTRSNMGSLCRWFIQQQTMWGWSGIGKPSRGKSGTISSLQLSGIKQSSRVRSHYSRPELGRGHGS